MSAAPITSAEEFADALRDVADRYMMHLEPSATAQQYAVTMDVVGESLNITFRKQPGEKPYIAFTLQATAASDATTTASDSTTTASGLFGRRS